MQVYRELFLRGDRDKLAATLDLVTGTLRDGWSRDTASEERIRGANHDERAIYCFACSTDSGHPAATLSIMDRDPGTYYVTNIVPQKIGRLNRDEYNGILTDFCERVVRPAAAQTGVVVKLTEAYVELEHWLSVAAARKLRDFSAIANKNTGSAHPYDRDLWNAFLVSAHREDSSLDATSLGRWLVEIEGWPEEEAEELSLQYEFGRALLKTSDHLQRSASR